MSLRLCGLDVPYERQRDNKTTADWMYQACSNLSKGSVLYDNLDIRGTIQSLTDGADGIIRAVSQKCTKDIKGNPLSQKELASELYTLQEALQKVIGIITKAWESRVGQTKWGPDVLDQNAPKTSCYHKLYTTPLSTFISTLKQRVLLLKPLA